MGEKFEGRIWQRARRQRHCDGQYTCSNSIVNTEAHQVMITNYYWMFLATRFKDGRSSGTTTA
jgi:hypothetical protein